MRPLPDEPTTSSPALLLVFHLERLTGLKLWLARGKTTSHGIWEHDLRLLDQRDSSITFQPRLNSERWGNIDLARSVRWLRTLDEPQLISALVGKIDLDTKEESTRRYTIWWDIRTARVNALNKFDVWLNEVPMKSSDDEPWFSITFDPAELKKSGLVGAMTMTPFVTIEEVEKLRDHLVQNPTLDYLTISRWMWALVEERPKPERQRKKATR